MSKAVVKTQVSKKYVPDQLHVDIAIKAYADSHDECISKQASGELLEDDFEEPAELSWSSDAPREEF